MQTNGTIIETIKSTPEIITAEEYIKNLKSIKNMPINW
jgi:hypothetical protein